MLYLAALCPAEFFSKWLDPPTLSGKGTRGALSWWRIESRTRPCPRRRRPSEADKTPQQHPHCTKTCLVNGLLPSEPTNSRENGGGANQKHFCNMTQFSQSRASSTVSSVSACQRDKPRPFGQVGVGVGVLAPALGWRLPWRQTESRDGHAHLLPDFCCPCCCCFN